MPYDALLKGRHSELGRAYFVTTVTFRRAPAFSELPCARLVVQEMRKLHDQHALRSLCWVLMPDHLHWLFQLDGRRALSEVIKQFKGRSARAVNQRLNRTGPLWQKSYHDHGLRDDEDPLTLARYIVANPLRKHLVDDIGQYPHWDADWL